MQDLRYALRMLRRSPGFSAIAILMLALGTGANTAIFTVVNAALLRPLPYPRPDRLVTILDDFTKTGYLGYGPTVPEYLDIQARNRVFDEMAFLDHRDMQIAGGDHPERVYCARVSASFFPLLGARAALGRTFLPEENRPGRTDVVVLSDSLWRRNFGADPGIVGRKVLLSGNPHTVLGVLPPDFAFDYRSLGIADRVDLYFPFLMDAYYSSRSGELANVRRVHVLARLKDGVTQPQMAADLSAIGQSLVKEYPAVYTSPQGPIGFALRASPLHEEIAGRSRLSLIVLLCGVGLVLLIACANVANLLLSRAAMRRKEIAVRMSLGATRRRIVRQVLTESGLLGAIGGTAGMLLAVWGIPILGSAAGRNLPVHDVRVDATVLAYTVLISVLTAILAGAIPAMQSARLIGKLSVRGAAASGRPGRGAAGRALVIAEIALSVILVTGAALLARSLVVLTSVPTGISADRVLTMQITLPFRSYNGMRQGGDVYTRFLDRIAAVPGVEYAAATSVMPLRAGYGEASFTVPGYTGWQTADYRIVSPDYFRALGIPLREGRPFQLSDGLDNPRVAIVNQTLASKYWPNQAPAGKQIQLGHTLFSIAGVVADARSSVFQLRPLPQLYVSYLQAFEPNMNFAIRTKGDPAQMVAEVRKAIWSVDSNQAVFKEVPLPQVMSAAAAEPRFRMILSSLLAGLALVMAAVGLFGLLSHMVAQRTPEIAIRVAVGATSQDVLGLVSREVLGLTAAGLALGGAGSIASPRLIQSLLYGAGAGSPLTFAAVLLLFLAVAFLAAYVPARRASRVDPMTALRCE